MLSFTVNNIRCNALFNFESFEGAFCLMLSVLFVLAHSYCFLTGFNNYTKVFVLKKCAHLFQKLPAFVVDVLLYPSLVTISDVTHFLISKVLKVHSASC